MCLFIWNFAHCTIATTVATKNLCCNNRFIMRQFSRRKMHSNLNFFILQPLGIKIKTAFFFNLDCLVAEHVLKMGSKYLPCLYYWNFILMYFWHAGRRTENFAKQRHYYKSLIILALLLWQWFFKQEAFSAF